MAKIAHVAEQTARNYTRDYAPLFSPSARGDNGPRLFTDADVQMFCAIAELRRANVPPAEVLARLTRGDIYIDATPQQATTDAQDGPQGTQMPLAVHDDLQRQIDALRPAFRRSLWSHGIAFYLGMVTMGVVFMAVWLLVNGW